MGEDPCLRVYSVFKQLLTFMKCLCTTAVKRTKEQNITKYEVDSTNMQKLVSLFFQARKRTEAGIQASRVPVLNFPLAAARNKMRLFFPHRCKKFISPVNSGDFVPAPAFLSALLLFESLSGTRGKRGRHLEKLNIFATRKVHGKFKFRGRCKGL